jgi:hypothetical protein
MAIQGISIWHFHYSKLVHPLSTLVPFLCWFLQVWMFLIPTCIESTSTIFTFFSFFICLPPHISVFLVLHSWPLLLGYLFNDFHLSTLPANVLWLSQSQPTSLQFLILSSTAFIVFYCLVPTQLWCTSLLFTICLSFFSSSLGLLYESHFGYMFWICWYVCMILLVFVWAYIPHMRENMSPLAFWTWLTSFKMIFFSSIHLPAN